MNKLAKKIYESDELIFWVISIIFAVIMYFAKWGGDDVAALGAMKSQTIGEAWRLGLGEWFTWSSRLLINLVFRILIILPRGVWGLYACLTMYILLKSLSVLFCGEKNKSYYNLFITFLVMTLPWVQLSTAGWVGTMATYFGPLALGLCGLIPIAKVYRDESMHIGEKLFYVFALIYGTNVEQMMVVALFCYLSAIVYFEYKKRRSVYLWGMLTIVVGSMLNVLFCPGNAARKIKETATWFPSYVQFDFVDKLDIGFFSTVRSLFLDNVLLSLIVMCVVLAIGIWKKYTSILYRCVGVFPVVTLIVLGPLKNFIIYFFPDIQYLYNEMSQDGLVTLDNVSSVIGMCQYAVMFLICAMILLSILLISDSVEQMYTSFVLLLAGLASRVAIALSPTIYASSTRTFQMLYFCVVAVGIQLVCQHVDVDKMSLKKINFTKIIMIGGIMISLLELVLLIGVRFVLY